jgi:hypothetical protein
MSLAKAAVLFRALGLRHLLVVPKTPGVRPLYLRWLNIFLFTCIANYTLITVFFLLSCTDLPLLGFSPGAISYRAVPKSPQVTLIEGAKQEHSAEHTFFYLSCHFS